MKTPLKKGSKIEKQISSVEKKKNFQQLKNKEKSRLFKFSTAFSTKCGKL